jgi:predicted nucleic acid-binding Zn ribbon protein
VRQIRRAELDTAVDKADVKSKKEKPKDRFNVGSVVEPGYVSPKRCSVCGIPIGPSEDECDVCRYKAETRRSAHSDVITIHNVPYAIIDRQF